MRKVLFVLVFILIIILIAVFLPWNNVSRFKDKILGERSNAASLKVYSLGGDMSLYIDGEKRGDVLSKSSYLEVFPIEEGDHLVQLVREGSEENFYVEFKEIIWFEKGFDTVVSWEVGPSEELSSGWILYAKKLNKNDTYAYLNINCESANCKCKLNDQEDVKIDSKIQLDKSNQYTIEASADGYQNLVVSIFPEDPEEREKLTGYDLFLEVNLFKIPI